MTSLYHFMADILAGCYAVTHNYALAIALLTVVVVAVTTPLTWKSTRGMLAMQMLAPEIKKLQAKYKNDKETLNREMMALYKENSINPLGGCLPLLPQMVVFFVLYRTIYNLSHKATFATFRAAQAACPHPANAAAQITKLTSGVKGGKPFTCADPQNISHGSHLYQNLVAAGGHMKVWGFDLTLGVRTAHGGAVVGCWILVVLVVGAYYLQTRQMSSRNPAAAAANPQMQSMQKIFPIFFGFISITIQAGVNIYFLVSALCRIGQQSLMYRHDPVLRRFVENAKKAGPIDVQSQEKKGFFASLMTPPTSQPPPKRSSGSAPRGGGGRGTGGGSNGAPRAGSGNGRASQPPSPRPPVPAPSPDAGAPKGTLARIWAAASGAAPPSPPTGGSTAPGGSPSAGAAPTSGGTGPDPSPPPTPPRAAGNGSPGQKAGDGAPRSGNRNRSRAKRRRR